MNVIRFMYKRLPARKVALLFHRCYMSLREVFDAYYSVLSQAFVFAC